MWGSLIAVIIGKAVWDGSKSKLPPEQQREVNRHFTKVVAIPFGIFLAIAMLISLVTSAFSQTTNRTFQDSMGRNTGRSSTDARGNTTFYDNMGRNQGRSSTQNGTTTYYDNMGRQSGTVRSNK